MFEFIRIFTNLKFIGISNPFQIRHRLC
jgi:hypothetical protein